MSCAIEVPVYGWPEGGWDAGASIDYGLAGENLYIAWAVTPASNGVAVGLSGQDYKVHYSDINHCIMVFAGEYAIYESGVKITEFTPVGSAWEFVIARVGSVIHYLYRLDSEQGQMFDDPSVGYPLPGHVLYTSAIPSYGKLVLDSALYAIGDKFCVLDYNSTVPGSPIAYLHADMGLHLTGTGSDTDVELLVSNVFGYLPLTLTGSGSAQDGVHAGSGKLYLDGHGWDQPYDAVGRGYLTFEMYGTGGVSVDQQGQTSYINGQLPLTGYASGSQNYPSGLFAGELPIVIAAAGSSNDPIGVDTFVVGALPIVGGGFGRPDLDDALTAVANGYLPLIGEGFGRADADGALQAVMDGVLPLALYGSGYPAEYDDNPPVAFASGEVIIELYGSGSAEYDNYLHILLPELGSTAVLPSLGIEITDEIRASMSLQAQYVIMVREFVELVTASETFTQQSVELLELATAVATAIPGYSLWVQETLGITGTLGVVQVLELADALVARSMVQNQYQGVIAVLSAVRISDGGAGAGPVGSGAILDSNGVSGDPAEIALYGWFPTGTFIGISYVTDTGGPDSVSYTLIAHRTGEQVAERLVAMLDAQPYISSTYAGNGVIEILPADGATVVNI